MTNTLQKYVAPEITPSLGGVTPVATTDGLPGYQPATVGGFYPTAPYAALRTFINGEGKVELYPKGYTDYRLRYDLLTQQPAIGLPEITQLVENNLRGQFDPARAYVYMLGKFNVWEVGQIQPYVLPQAEAYIQVLPFSWGAGGVTSDGFVNGAFSFTVTQGTYAVVGISGPAADPADPSSIDYGFFFRSVDTVQVIERGVISAITTTYALPANVFSIRVVGRAVDYLVNGTSVRQATLPPTVLPVAWSGIAALYGANSSVSGISVTQYAGGDMTVPALRLRFKRAELSLPALRGTAGWLPYARTALPALRFFGGSAPYAHVTARMRALTMTARGFDGLSLRPLRVVGGNGSVGGVRLPRLAAVGADYTYATAAVALPLPTVRGYAGRPTPLGGMVSLPRIRAIGTGSSGAGGTASVRLPALRSRSAYYASASIALRRPNVFGYQDPAGEAFISGAPSGMPSSSGGLVLFASINAAGSISMTASAIRVLDGQMPGSIVVVSTATVQQLLNAIMNSALVGASFEPLSEQGAETWIVNAATGASSSYENYSFNSFATVDGRLYGARSDGLYLLEGDTDAGSPIRASLSFGSTDFGTPKLKRLEAAYLGVSSTGDMYLKVRTEGGNEYTYVTRRNDDFMRQQRIDVGRGIRASYLTFELYNGAGCDFELNTVSVNAAVLSRSI